eukprot:3409716-Prymnesium_polylepis.1
MHQSVPCLVGKGFCKRVYPVSLGSPRGDQAARLARAAGGAGDETLYIPAGSSSHGVRRELLGASALH